MIKCGYCYTENLEESSNCDFCEAPLQIERPMLREPQKFVDEDIYYLTYPMLKKYNHVELFSLLRLAREQKQIIKQENSEEMNKYLTLFEKKIHLIENAIFDMMGRVPKRVGPYDMSKFNNIRRNRMTLHRQLMTPQKEVSHHKFFRNRFAAEK